MTPRRPSARFGRIVDAARWVNAVVALAKREGLSLDALLRAVQTAWRERCDSCGGLYDLHDSDGSRCCTRCADTETVHEFLRRE
jgi:hypothetical protein